MKTLDRLQDILRQYKADDLELLRQGIRSVLDDTALFNPAEESEELDELRVVLLELSVFVYTSAENPDFRATLLRFKRDIEASYTKVTEARVGTPSADWRDALRRIIT